MADEPRRSGRAGKGQNAKLKEDEPKTKGKRAPRANPDPDPDPEDEEEEEEEENIRCICGEYDPDEEGRAMICCDSCSAWQHNDCMGLPDDYEADKYFCEQCKPENHKELLAAIKRGETAKAVASRRRETGDTTRTTKKKGKKGRKSATGRVSEARDTPVTESEEPVSSRKRKLEESPIEDSKAKKAKGVVSARASKKSTQLEQNVIEDPEEITNATRRKSAAGVVKLFIDQIVDADKTGAYKVTASIQDEGKQLGLQVEQAVYNVRSGGAGEPNEDYKMQIRAIIHNVKNNPDLAVRLMKTDISPKDLAAMEPKDMASDAQKQKDAELKINLEKQHTLVEEEVPRIRRTHKGDEYVDDNQQLAESVTSRAAVKKEATDDQETEIKSAGPTPDGRKVMRRSSTNKGQPFGDMRRKSSANFNIDKVWSGVQGSPTEPSTARFPDAPGSGSPPPRQTHEDPEIDKLLKDEDEASEPYSPREFVEDGVVWQGVINGGTLGTFNAQAKFAAGCQPDVDNLRLSWSEVIPKEIKLHGRIQPQRADEYLCGLEYSNTTELIIVTVAEPKNASDSEQFNKFFKYLKDKERYGVGMQHQVPAIKDIYLLPLDVGQALPSVMKALQHNQPDPVADKQFLIPIVIKWTELPHNVDRIKHESEATMSPSLGPTVAQTPITPSEHAPMHFPPYHPPQAGPAPAPTNGHAPLPYPTPTAAPPAAAQPAASTPLSAQSATQQNVAHGPSIGMQNAIRVLGSDLAMAPAVVALLQQAPNAGEYEMTIIRDCIQENAMAAQDLQVLTFALTQKNQARKGYPHSG